MASLLTHVTMIHPLHLFFQIQHTPRFSGAQHHQYLLDFLKCVAERYRDDRQAGDLVLDLLNLKVPKLFAVKQGENDEGVCHRFVSFLENYICKDALKHTILEKMSDILVREANGYVLCMHRSIYMYM